MTSPLLSGQSFLGLLLSAFACTIVMVCVALPILKRRFSVQKEKLRSEYERLALVLEANHDGIFDVDLRTGNVFYSTRWLAQLGYLPDEIPGRTETWLDRVHPEDRESAEQKVADYLSHRAPTYEAEYRIRHRDGHWCWIHARAQAVWNEKGEAIRLVGSHSDITQRRQTEAELKASEALFSGFLENNPAVTFVEDQEGRYIHVNRAFEKLVGSAAGAIIGKRDVEIWQPDVAKEMRQNARTLFESQRATEALEAILMLDGSTRRFLTTRFPLCDATGRQTLGGIALDVTERLNAEESLQESEAKYRKLFQQNPLPAWIYRTQDFRIVDVNEAAISHYGWSRAEFLSLTVHAIRAPEEFEAVEVDLTDRWLRRELSGPWHHRRKDGSVTLVELAGMNLESRSGPTRLVVVNDITARLEAEKQIKDAHDRLETLVEERTAELRDSQLKWQVLVEAIPQIVWASGPHGEADYMSVRAAEYAGLPVSEINDGKWVKIVHPADRNRAVAIWQTAISSGLSYESEFRLRSSSGEYRWFKSMGRPVRDGDGQIVRWIGTCTDIEQQKRSEEALEDAVARRTIELAEARDRAEAATRAKSQFLAAMSHEIRTPMNGVIGMANLMFDTELTSQQRCFMDTIRSSGEALLTVINDILDLSKIEAGRLSLEQTQFDLSTLIDEATELVASQAAAKNLPLSCKVDSAVPLDLLGDPVRLRQVVLNLLSNAVKFTAEGSVSLLVTREAMQNEVAMLRFAIKDTGIGLTQAQQDGLFQAFHQSELSTSRRFGGTGLGLAISKRLVEMMGGSIGVHSQIGEGSTFWFNVCLKAVPVFEEGNTFNGKHIALISTLSNEAEPIRTHLESVGLRVSIYPRIPRRNRKQFDLLLIEASALVGTVDVAQIASCGEVPLVVLGSKSDCKSVEGVHELVAAFIEKPVRRMALLRSIEAVLDGKPVMSSAHGQGSQGARTQRVYVLLAEDNKVNQLVARLLLEKLNCRVDVVENGVEACTAVQRNAYDLVLMDCQMPVMSGFEATKRIRGFETSKRRTPIVALTAGVLQEERDRCYASGMDGFLSKPISPKELESTLERWIPLPAEA